MKNPCTGAIPFRRRWFIGMLLMTAAGGLSAAEDTLERTFDTLAQSKAQCEEEVRQVKRIYKSSDQRYKETQRLFDRLRASANAWIDQIRVRLVAGRSLGDAAMKESADQFRRQSIAFLDHARKLDEKGQSRGALDTLLSLLPTVIEALPKLYEQRQKATGEERDRLLAEFERLRFAQFKQL